MFSKPTPIVLNLIIINIIVFFTGNMLHSTNNFLSLHYVGSSLFNPIQFFTSTFVHADFKHIFFNMIGLFVFGPILENHLGSGRFLTYYVICGIGANLLFSGYIYYDMYQLKQAISIYMARPEAESFSNIFSKYDHRDYLRLYSFINEFAAFPNDKSYINISIQYINDLYNAKANVPIMGASGAIYGIDLGVAMIFPALQVYLFFIPVPIKMVYIVIFYCLMSIYGMVQNNPNDNVAHFAHLSGMIVGFILLKIWGEKRANYY